MEASGRLECRCYIPETFEKGVKDRASLAFKEKKKGPSGITAAIDPSHERTRRSSHVDKEIGFQVSYEKSLEAMKHRGLEVSPNLRRRCIQGATLKRG